MNDTLATKPATIKPEDVLPYRIEQIASMLGYPPKVTEKTLDPLAADIEALLERPFECCITVERKHFRAYVQRGHVKYIAGGKHLTEAAAMAACTAKIAEVRALEAQVAEEFRRGAEEDPERWDGQS